ncbi:MULTISPECIES: sensor domain-containing diguanylate cyclase [unclassified Burkholderia]|uniref:sensor domain-containing diguanylate cyclase n=1 Tax=unclassified Burkholderia TaxID=2613784 RepID=UPI000F5A3887|nr:MULTISPECIES: sensor domain-containing diguanylate cyclase [unclassified Burkholderia]RQS57813.1 GGDEF domain-containing protein [Burkholderia sp. Bp8986]RQS64083.1 GGDEF domain-containing protein [Burkholderia sp. Bp8984]
MSTTYAAGEPPRVVSAAARLYAKCLLVGFALLPAYLIAYLWFFSDPHVVFENHAFHEIAITAATLEGAFVTYVTWVCYRSSGEPLLRWLTLGFLGFAMIYALHGLFTGMAHHNIWLFLLYGPASRLVMSILLLKGLLSYSQPPDRVEKRTRARTWLPWVGLFVTINVAVAYIAYSPVAGAPGTRLSMEGGALVFSLLNVGVLLARRIRSPLMVIYGVSIMAFALSSLAFILGKPWNHMWWLAHAIFAGGFFLLSYGVVQALQTTRSFSAIYSQEDLMSRLSESMARTESALQELRRTNQKLEYMAATDPMTGASNRRQFIAQVEREIVRAERDGTPFCLLALDLDNFKNINDAYGHQIGDEVLRGVVRQCLEAIRPAGALARVGGEEFMALLPEMPLEGARMTAERVRSSIASSPFGLDFKRVQVTVSVGVAQYGVDGGTVDALLRAVDERLYQAKRDGRNRVVAH